MGGAFGSLIGYRCERRHFPSPLVFGGLLYAFTRSRSGVYRTRLPVYPQLSRGNTLQMPPWYCSGSGSRQPPNGESLRHSWISSTSMETEAPLLEYKCCPSESEHHTTIPLSSAWTLGPQVYCKSIAPLPAP